MASEQFREQPPMKRKRGLEDATLHPYLPSELLKKEWEMQFPPTTGIADVLRYPIFVYGPYDKKGNNNCIEVAYVKETKTYLAASISDRDTAFFRRNGVIMLRILSMHSGGHILVIIKSPTSNKCQIFDPNGSIHITYKDESEEITALRDAVEQGLLLGLDPHVPLSMEFVDRDIGLQVEEVKGEAKALSSTFSNAYFEPVRTIISYECIGFCQSWSTFRMIDYILTGGKTYDYLAKEHPYQGQDMVAILNNGNPTFSESFFSWARFSSSGKIQAFYLCARLPVLIRLIAMHIIDIGFYLEECANPDLKGDPGYLANDTFSFDSKVGLLKRDALFGSLHAGKIAEFWKPIIADPSNIFDCLGNQPVLSKTLRPMSTGFGALQTPQMLNLICIKIPYLGNRYFFPKFPFRYDPDEHGYEPHTRTFFIDDTVGYAPRGTPISAIHWRDSESDSEEPI